MLFRRTALGEASDEERSGFIRWIRIDSVVLVGSLQTRSSVHMLRLLLFVEFVPVWTYYVVGVTVETTAISHHVDFSFHERQSGCRARWASRCWFVCPA